MDVEAGSFAEHLLGLLINISDADFVSFDLEMSGIPSKMPDKPARQSTGRMTMDERYQETKQGADRYSILQVGLTCAKFDHLANQYVLRPYNIYISPLVDEKLDIEREVTYQSGAVSFLLQHGFDMAKPYTHGVQYLSRGEAEYAKQKAWDRLDNKTQPADLQLKESDLQSLDFMRRVRVAIAEWRQGGASSLEITTHVGLKEQPGSPQITRFEKRLVHQLVRAEFSDLVSIGRTECIRILHYDATREADNIQRIKDRIKEQILRQTGFRWVFDALSSGFATDPLRAIRRDGIFANSSLHNLRHRYERAIEHLKTHQPVLVGHNMFTDIVYLYRTFVGELPDTLTEFNKAIHGLFPKIVDTKYLATHDEGDLNVSPSLQDIAETLIDQPLPRIVTDPDHDKYEDGEAYHEAGYDSLQTATIMIRLSAKLNHEQSPHIAARPISETDADYIRDGREKIDKPVPVPPTESSWKEKPSRRQHPRQAGVPITDETTSAARSANTNMFSRLQDSDLDASNDSDASSEELTFEDAEPSAQHDGWETQGYGQDENGWTPIEQKQRQPMEHIPAFDTDFWKAYGNTLRVFGTEEAVLKIAEW